MENYIYIGPNIPRLGLHKSDLFIGNNPPQKLQEAISKSAMIGVLFIKTSALAQAQKSLRDVGSIENQAIKKLVEVSKGMI